MIAAAQRWTVPAGSVWERRWGESFLVYRVLRTYMNGAIVMVEVERLDPSKRGAREVRSGWWLHNRAKRIR